MSGSLENVAVIMDILSGDKNIDKEFDGVIMVTYENTLTRRVSWERDCRERSRWLKASYFGTF